MTAPGRPGWLRGLVPALVLVLLGASFASPLFAQSGSASTNPEALARLAAAAELASRGGWDRALELAEEVLDLSGDDPDALYLSSLALLKGGDRVRDALARLEAIPEGADFRIYSLLSARDLRASLLLRLGRTAEVLRLLPGTATAADLLDPEYRRLRALAFLRAGQDAAALKELSLGAARFPDDPSLARIFFEGFSRKPSTEAARTLAATFLARLSRLGAVDADLGLLAVPFVLNPEDRKVLILARRALGGFPLLGTLEALEYGIIGDAKALEETFPRGDLPFRDLETLEGLLGSADGKAGLAAALGTFTGRLTFDRDGDGVSEETAEYARGALTAWRRDADQDGDPEAWVAFRDGLPATYRYAVPGLLLAAAYDRYPSVARLEVSDLPSPLISLSPGGIGGSEGHAAATKDVFTFAPGAFLLTPLELAPFPSRLSPALFVPRLGSDRGATREAAVAAALAVGTKSGVESVLTSLQGGIPLRRERILEGRLYAVVDYQNGRAQVERVDSDLDGRFETQRAYLPGTAPEAENLAWIKVDADGDGLFEYVEYFGPKSAKAWDFDRDGRIDARELALPDGGRRRELSSRLDGNFDEILVLSPRGGILAVYRDGGPVTLVPDANPALRWMGIKPFDLGPSLPKAEGIYSVQGRRYRLVWVGSEAFAEVLQ